MKIARLKMLFISIIAWLTVGIAYIRGWIYWLECMDGFVDNVVFKVLWWTVHAAIAGWIVKGVFL